jgi:hypothetical protein
MQFFSSTKTKTEKRAIEEEWRMDSIHTYNSHPTGRTQNDILETVQVVTMLRAVMRSCTIPINPNYTKVDKSKSNSGDRGLIKYVRKDVGINTFRSESFTMFVVLGTHGSYELGAAHGEPHIALRSGSMTKDMIKEIVPSNIAWFSTLSGSDAVDRPTTGSSTLVVYTEKAGYACDESDYLDEDFRFTNDIPLQRREQLPDAIGIPSDTTRPNALKLIYERLDSSDGQYDKVDIALFANDDSATQNAYEPTPQQPNAAPAAPAGAGAKVVYQLWDAEYQCHFYTIADCQWLVARLIWEKRGFTGVSVPDLPDSDVHRKLFVHKGFASLVNDALEFSNHTVMKAIRDLRSTTGNNGREPFQLFQGADEIQHNTLLNEVMGDVMRATWTAVHNKEASILHALFQCAADKTTWSSIEERVMSAVSLLANIWERLVGEPDRVLGEDLTAVSKPIVHAFRQLFAWMTESQGEGYDTFHAGASIFSARGAWGRVLDDDDESATPSVYYLPRLKTYVSSMRGFDYFCMIAVHNALGGGFLRLVGGEGPFAKVHKVPFGRFEVPLYPKGFVRDIQESLRILVLNSTPVAFRRYRENAGTTARLSLDNFIGAANKYQNSPEYQRQQTEELRKTRKDDLDRKLAKQYAIHSRRPVASNTRASESFFIRNDDGENASSESTDKEQQRIYPLALSGKSGAETIVEGSLNSAAVRRERHIRRRKRAGQKRVGGYRSDKEEQPPPADTGSEYDTPPTDLNYDAPAPAVPLPAPAPAVLTPAPAPAVLTPAPDEIDEDLAVWGPSIEV